jgi:hypothetical protein
MSDEIANEILALRLKKRALDEAEMAHNRVWAEETKRINARLDALERRGKFTVVTPQARKGRIK